MNWDELQRQNRAGGANHLPDPRLLSEAVQQAIEKAISAHRDNNVIHVKISINAPNISFTVELSYTPVQPQVPQVTTTIVPVDGAIIGEEDA